MLVFISCSKDDGTTNFIVNESVSKNAYDLVFTSDKSGKLEIWRHQDSTYTQLTNESSDCWWGRIDDKGEQLYYLKSRELSSFNDFEQTALEKQDLLTGNILSVINGDKNGFQLSGTFDLSNDGNQLIFCATDSLAKTSQLYLCENDGQNIHKISQRDNTDYLNPSFSYDGTMVYYSAIPEGASNEDESIEIFSLNLINHIETRLTFNNTSDLHPSANRDNSIIIYESLVDEEYLQLGKWSINGLDVKTGKEQVLVSDKNINLYPRFTKDQKAIYYVSLDVTTFSMGLFKFETESGNISRVTSSDFNALSVDLE